MGYWRGMQANQNGFLEEIITHWKERLGNWVSKGHQTGAVPNTHLVIKEKNDLFSQILKITVKNTGRCVLQRENILETGTIMPYKICFLYRSPSSTTRL